MAIKIRVKLIIAFFVMLIPFSIFAWLTNLAYSALHSNSVRMNAFAVEIDGYAKIQLRIDELERFQAVAVQREFRIKELRDKVVKLESIVVELESIQRG
ncbi:MAG: hypothetical protein A2132_07240 [Nitrospirae bacterium RBG_16_43_11]|nr:MAG: hypothetical protein A2132_07240 [Nitrospirae bacterium RBG_16_43_11]